MEVVNPFILKNKERMIVFLDQLSSVSDPNPPPGTYIESNASSSSDTGNYSHISLIKNFLHAFIYLSIFSFLPSNTRRS